MLRRVLLLFPIFGFLFSNNGGGGLWKMRWLGIATTRDVSDSL